MTISLLPLGILAFFVLVRWLRVVTESRKLAHIPALTSELPLLSSIGALRFHIDANGMLQRGYDEYKHGVFKIPEFSRWHVFVTGKTLVDELRKADESELSHMEAVSEFMQMEYSFGEEFFNNDYHGPIMRTTLSRDLRSLFPDIYEELVAATRDQIPLTHDWIAVPAAKTVMQIVCRTSNRVFSGLPLCRNSEFLKLNIDFVIETVKASFLIGAVPQFLRKFVARLTGVETIKRRSEELLRPVIAETLKQIEQHGPEWYERMNGMLPRLVEAAPKDESFVPSVSLRILTTNFAAIHTSSMTFSHVLYQVAAYPQYQAELRHEVDRVVAEYGWTKEAVARMIKIDSFIKETTRYVGLTIVALSRQAMKDFTFSDGTFIPKGTLVSTAARPLHFDEQYYENPNVFDPWRYAKMESGALADRADYDALKNQFANIRPEIFTFGSGKHACPGRFFASIELKSLLAHFVYTYEMKMKNEGKVPPPLQILTTIIPNQSAKVMFRKRREHPH